MQTVSIHEGEWTFPHQIKFEEVSHYLTHFEAYSREKHIIFDLRNTTTIHSSFIGFLLHVKKNIEEKNGKFELKLSYTAAKIFQMLNILEHLSPVTVQDSRKSA